MSAPLKPWERAGPSHRASSLSSVSSPSRFPPRPRSNLLQPSGSPANKDATMSSNGQSDSAPAVPPRPQTHRPGVGSMYGSSQYGYGGLSSYSGHGGYGMYGGRYGGYGMGMGTYGGYGGYGGYGSYGMYGNQVGTQDSQSSFVRRAEESSRTAFQSIEAIVQAFGSVAMMLESTHFAMHNSFRAVLGVADHFSRLKTHLVSILGTITLFRAVRYIVYKVLSFLGLWRQSGMEDEIWTEAKTALARTGTKGDGKKSPRSWPIIMFLAVVVGAPWLIWKLLQSFVSEENNEKDWMTGEGDHVLAKAEYDFDGDGDDELSFRAGSVLRLAPKHLQPRMRGWLLGTVDGCTEGIIPGNYVKILGLRRGRKRKTKESSEEQGDILPGPSTSPVQQDEVAVDLNQEYSTIAEDMMEETVTADAGMDRLPQEFELPELGTPEEE